MHNVVEKQGYKFTEEFGYIPEDWNVLNIIENSTLKARIGWQGLTTAEYLKSGDYYLVTGTDFCNGKIDWGNCNYVDKNRYNQDKNIQIKEEDILITKDGTIGKIAYIDKISKPTTLNSGVFVVRPKMQNYNPKYLYYVLMSNTFTRFLKKLTAGSTIMHLYQKDFIGFNFQAPSEQSEQEKIAEVLSDIDELISTQKLIDKKKNLKTATMQKLLTSQDTWQKYTLGQIGNVLMCKRIMKDETKEIGQIPFYKIGTFGGKPDAYISKNLFEIYKRKYSYPNKGDILISASGTIGRTIMCGCKMMKQRYLTNIYFIFIKHLNGVQQLEGR